MRKRIGVTLILMCSITAFAMAETPSAWGIDGYLLSGWNARSTTFTAPYRPAATIDASGFLIELGGSVRWTPLSLIAVQLAGGVDWYLAAKGTVDAMGVAAGYPATYYTGSEYSDGDDMATFIAGDVYLFVPFLPLNVFAGYKLSLFMTDLIGTIEGTNAVRFGVEIPITQSLALRVIGEMPFASAKSYNLWDGATISSAMGYNVQAEAVFALN
jgi:hypothetical protein